MEATKNARIANEHKSQIDSYGLELTSLGDVKEKPIVEQPTDAFHIGQCYETEPCDQVFCKKCGGDQFIVGTSDFFTAIKCPKCQWEYCIHDG